MKMYNSVNKGNDMRSHVSDKTQSEVDLMWPHMWGALIKTVPKVCGTSE